MRRRWMDAWLGIDPLVPGSRIRNKVFYDQRLGCSSTYANVVAAALFLLCVPVVTLVVVLRDIRPGEAPWWLMIVPVVSLAICALDVLGTTLLVRRLKRTQDQSELS